MAREFFMQTERIGFSKWQERYIMSGKHEDTIVNDMIKAALNSVII